jgi:hypothetical protein
MRREELPMNDAKPAPGNAPHAGARAAAPPRPRKRGQGLVEFALVLPILLMLIFGIIEFGYYFFVVVTINNSTRHAVRKASFNNLTRPQIEGLVVSAAVGVGVSSNEVEITTRASDAAFPGSPPPPTVEILTTFQHKFFAPVLWQRDSLLVKSHYKAIVTTYVGGGETITF